ncbi:MAG: hypothetical protein ACYC99_11660 [Candidatus Geothermincolia bacterium]
MALDTGLAFKFMRINYKYGLLDEVGAIAGEALEAVLREQRMDMEDLLNMLDGASEGTIEKINGILDRWGTIFLRLAANEQMTRLQAYLLKKPPVRRGAVKAATHILRKRLAPQPLDSGSGTRLSASADAGEVGP